MCFLPGRDPSPSQAKLCRKVRGGKEVGGSAEAAEGKWGGQEADVAPTLALTWD